MRITLNNFHNNKPLVLENISKLNIVLGENGIGKTKLLRNLSRSEFAISDNVEFDCLPDEEIFNDPYELECQPPHYRDIWLSDRNFGSRMHSKVELKQFYPLLTCVDNFCWNVSFRNIDKLCSDFLQSVSINHALSTIFIASNNSLAITTLLQKIVNTELEKDVNIIAMYRNKDKEINIRNMKTAQEALDNVENYSENHPLKIV